jgi:hypothetical protein
MRNPFKRDPDPLPTTADPTLRDLVGHLSHDVSELKSELASIRFEWAEVLDKINRWSAREATRRRRDTMRALSDEPAQAVPDPAPTEDRGSQAKLELWRKANQA